MTIPPVRAVAFDAVGTLIHPDPPAVEVYAAIGRRFGSRRDSAEVRARFAAAFAAQERLDVEAGLATSEERERRRWQAIVAHVLDDAVAPDQCFAELYEHFARPAAWRCDEDAAELLVRLRRAGYPIALASNYDHRLRRVVAGLPGLAPIDSLVISAEVGWRKPAPAYFAHLAATLGLPAHTILFVGDDLGNDFDGARRAGFPALLFDPRGRHPERLGERLNKLGDLRLP